MCSDAPDTTQQQAAALKSAELGQESFDWFKQEWERTAPDRAAATERANKVSDAQLAGMDFATQQAKETADRNRAVFQPLEDKIVTGAQEYDTPWRRAQASAEARAGVEANFGAATDGLNRTLQRTGVDVGDGRYLASMRDAAFEKAKAVTGATSAAEKGVEAQGYARMMDAAALGKGLVGNQATQQQIATTTGNASVGASGAGLGATTSGADLMRTGFSTGMQGFGQSGQLYGQAASLQKQDDSAAWGALGSIAGAFLLSEEGKKKGTGKAIDSKAALEQIKKTPVDTGWQYDPAKGGPDDGGMRHDGPMAADVRTTMGEAAAPGGKVIDLATVNGRILAGMQELAKRMDKLERKAA